MQHQTLETLRKIAEVNATPAPELLTPTERLARWAELLESEPNKRLSTLHETEYGAAAVRETMRATNSPLSVAFSDPVLRAAGLEGDTYGDAKRFFAITDWQLHDIVCYCHYGETVRSGSAARAVRVAISQSGPSLLARLREFVGHYLQARPVG